MNKDVKENGELISRINGGLRTYEIIYRYQRA